MTFGASAFGDQSFGAQPGAIASAYPAPEAVLAGVTYGPTGTEFVGTLIGGSGPSAAEIAQALLAAMNAAPPSVNMVQVRGQTITGAGSESDPWGPGG